MIAWWNWLILVAVHRTWVIFLFLFPRKPSGVMGWNMISFSTAPEGILIYRSRWGRIAGGSASTKIPKVLNAFSFFFPSPYALPPGWYQRLSLDSRVGLLLCGPEEKYILFFSRSPAGVFWYGREKEKITGQGGIYLAGRKLRASGKHQYMLLQSDYLLSPPRGFAFLLQHAAAGAHLRFMLCKHVGHMPAIKTWFTAEKPFFQLFQALFCQRQRERHKQNIARSFAGNNWNHPPVLVTSWHNKTSGTMDIFTNRSNFFLSSFGKNVCFFLVE